MGYVLKEILWFPPFGLLLLINTLCTGIRAGISDCGALCNLIYVGGLTGKATYIHDHSVV